MLLRTAHRSHNCDKFCPLFARPAMLSAAIGEFWMAVTAVFSLKEVYERRKCCPNIVSTYDFRKHESPSTTSQATMHMPTVLDEAQMKYESY